VASDDLELRKFQRNVIEIRNWSPRFGRAKEPRVSDLKAEGNAEFDTLGV
jgi:hypothetical protein